MLALSLLGTVSGCVTFATPGYRGPASAHFDGRRFHNEEPFPEQPPGAFLYWRLHRHRGTWKDETVPPGPPPPERVGAGELRVTFVNHATVLIQMDGLNILTDPVWSDRIGPVERFGTRRHRAPGVRLEDLPTIDVVLLSHDHYDHLDVPTLRRLVRAFHPRIIAGLGNRALLRRESIPAGEDLDWWESRPLAPGVRVTFVPAQHWSGRSLTDHCRTLWGGFVIEGAAGTVYFAGDTGWGDFLRQIHARWPSFRLAFLPVAPFRPRWYMRRKHLSPGDALDAARLLDARTSVAIHWGTFDLGDDGEEEVIDSLRREATSAPGSGVTIWALRNGEARSIPAMTPVGSTRAETRPPQLPAVTSPWSARGGILAVDSVLLAIRPLTPLERSVLTLSAVPPAAMWGAAGSAATGLLTLITCHVRPHDRASGVLSGCPLGAGLIAGEVAGALYGAARGSIGGARIFGCDLGTARRLARRGVLVGTLAGVLPAALYLAAGGRSRSLTEAAVAIAAPTFQVVAAGRSVGRCRTRAPELR